MRRLIMALAGILLLSGLQSAQAQQRPTEEQSFEITNVVFDYSYRPGNEYMEPDIVGSLTITAKIKGIDCLYPESSHFHYESPEEAPQHGWSMIFCEPDKEVIDITFPIMSWGAWARCRYYCYTTEEYVYSPYVWTTDYVDTETLDLVKGNVEPVVDNNELEITLMGRELLVTGLNGPASLRVYNIQGQTVLNSEIDGDESTSTVSLQDLEAGIYIVNVVSQGNTSTSKIALK